MELFKLTLMYFIKMLGFLTACVLYYMLFMAIGHALGADWIGLLLYGVVTLLGMAFITAKETMGAKL